MNDDKSVRCYALLAETLATGVDSTTQVKDLWLGMKMPTMVAPVPPSNCSRTATPVTMLWQRARLGMENDLGITQAIGIVSPGLLPKINAVYTNPGKYLNDKLTAFQPKTRELGCRWR